MNFPMELLIFQFFYWLVNTPGLGGIAVALVGGGSVVAYALALRWIRAGAQVEEKETYAYPTPALHQHETEG
ncbi:MAG: hypothetical protein HW418_498 [Anaerolineales bacterium]|jgi:hypothetical protein|nr:hypothetical protein [Anaerolineales bacterium]